MPPAQLALESVVVREFDAPQCWRCVSRSDTVWSGNGCSGAASKGKEKMSLQEFDRARPLFMIRDVYRVMLITWALQSVITEYHRLRSPQETTEPMICVSIQCRVETSHSFGGAPGVWRQAPEASSTCQHVPDRRHATSGIP